MGRDVDYLLLKSNDWRTGSKDCRLYSDTFLDKKLSEWYAELTFDEFKQWFDELITEYRAETLPSVNDGEVEFMCDIMSEFVIGGYTHIKFRVS
jgi:hypothetical protein